MNSRDRRTDLTLSSELRSRSGVARPRCAPTAPVAQRRRRAPGRRLSHTGNAPSARIRPLPRRL